MNLRDSAAAFVRTVTPVVVAYFLGFPAVKALGLTEEHVTALVTSVLTVLYWIAVHVFETYVSPKFGWLLGFARRPQYPAAGEIIMEPAARKA